MATDRRLVLAGVLAAVTAVNLAILKGMVGTIFFAATVAVVLAPVTDELERRGIPRWWASAVATASSFVAGLAVSLPIAAVLYVRRDAVLALIRSLPDSVVLSVGPVTYVIDSGDVAAFLAQQFTQVALALVRGTPVLAAKLVVFGFVVFALLYRGDRLRRALLAPVPDGYHAVLTGLYERIAETLFSLYVIQAVTAIGTFAVALVLFWALGIQYPVTLAVAAGVLQFLPVVGPSLLIAALAIAELVAGDVNGAFVIAVAGLVFVGFLPDAVLRPWLARETARLPSSLYFVGFTGGLLSLGPVGIVAGPIAVVLLLEALALLAAEMNQSRLEAFGT